MPMLTYDDIRSMKGNGSSMRLVLKYFLDKGAEVELLHEDLTFPERYYLVQYQGSQIPLRAARLNFWSTYNSFVAQTITINKDKTQVLLEAFRLPAPATQVYSDLSAAEKFLEEQGMLVVKPHRGAHGDGITTLVKDRTTLESAVQDAQRISEKVLLQQQVSGDDYRLLFLDYVCIAAVKRMPASITGDGKQTVRQLVEAGNQAKSVLWQKIRDGEIVDEEVRGSVSKTPLEEIIAVHGEEFLDTIPAAGEAVALVNKSNVSLGGQTQDVTTEINKELTEQVGKLLKSLDLRLCGVDVLSTDISSAPDARQSFVIELNAAPGLRLHELPTEGEPRSVCAQVAESLIKHYQSLQK